MAPTQLTSFRFRDLPSEIRNKVYQELLCDFRPRPTTVNPATMLAFAPACNDIDTAILRTNKTIYREAYDVLIKTGRFVKVTAVRGLPVRLLLNGLQVPVMTSDEDKVDKFKGYVLAIHLDSPDPIPATADNEGIFDACTLIILHRDFDVFCQTLTDGDAHMAGFNENLRILITVAPVLTEKQPKKATPSMRDFFSETTQRTLLAPSRAQLRGYKNAKIQGFVSENLAKAVQKDMNQDRWLDPKQILADFAAAKEKGAKLFQQRRLDDSCLVWQDAALDVDKMVHSSSWPTLVKHDGERFISQLAELYFLVRLNIAHVKIAAMQKPAGPYYEGIMAEDTLTMATRSLKQDHWMKGYRYRPSDQHVAKLKYRFALTIRLLGEPDTADQALRLVEGALRLQLDDAAILKEKETIMAWKRERY